MFYVLVVFVIHKKHVLGFTLVLLNINSIG